MQKEQTERLIDAVEKLAFVIDDSKRFQPKDYSQIFMNILMSLNSNNDYLDKIHHELKKLNKTIIMSALLTSAIKNPEKTLNEYRKIIDMYLK